MKLHGEMEYNSTKSALSALKKMSLGSFKAWQVFQDLTSPVDKGIIYIQTADICKITRYTVSYLRWLQSQVLGRPTFFKALPCL